MSNTITEGDEVDIDEALSSTESEIADDNSVNPTRKYCPSHDARVNYLVIS